MGNKLFKVIFLLCACTTLNAQDREIHLQVGQSAEIQFPNSETINLSSKNIVDIYFQETKSNWKVTALKNGFVIITPDSERDARILVTVDKDMSKKMADETFEVKKIYENPFEYFKNKKRCERDKECSFFSTLSLNAIKEWEKFLTIKFNLENVQTNSHGQSITFLKCKNGKNSENVTNKKWMEVDLIFQCISTKEKSNYKLIAKVIQVSDFDGSIIGIDYAQPHKLNNKVADNINVFAKKSESSIKIIGEQIIRLVSDEESRIVSGGELQSLQQTSVGSKEEWKKYGVELKVIVSPVEKERVLLDYKFSIRTPTASMSNMQLSEIESKIYVELNNETEGGGFVVSSKDKDVNEIPILGSIPIIAPIFNLFSDKKSNQRMIVTFLLEKEVKDVKESQIIQKQLKF